MNGPLGVETVSLIITLFIRRVVLYGRDSGLGVGTRSWVKCTQGKMKGQGSTERMKSRPNENNTGALEASERLGIGYVQYMQWWEGMNVDLTTPVTMDQVVKKKEGNEEKGRNGQTSSLDERKK